MPSNQNSAGAGKAAKFVNANPLGPMADPFAGLGDDEKEYQKVVAENVNNRMSNAVEDLRKKYKNGGGGGDNGEGNGPSGDAYQKHTAEMAKKRADLTKKQNASRLQDAEVFKAERANAKSGGYRNNTEDDEDEYDELLNELDDDPEMEMIRNSRMNEMRHIQGERAENLAKGHGQYRVISQDEFLTEVTSSTNVAIHFYHKEFERCKIMHHHLELIAPLHVECKFLCLDAERAPFFITRLQIQTLPTLITFKNGVVVERLMGFEDLAIDPSEPDRWHTSKLQQWLGMTGAIKFVMSTELMRNELKKMGIVERGNIWGENRDYDSDEGGAGGEDSD